jgi:hypothetical protein
MKALKKTGAFTNCGNACSQTNKQTNESQVYRLHWCKRNETKRAYHWRRHEARRLRLLRLCDKLRNRPTIVRVRVYDRDTTSKRNYETRDACVLVRGTAQALALAAAADTSVASNTHRRTVNATKYVSECDLLCLLACGIIIIICCAC